MTIASAIPEIYYGAVVDDKVSLTTMKLPNDW